MPACAGGRGAGRGRGHLQDQSVDELRHGGGFGFPEVGQRGAQVGLQAGVEPVHRALQELGVDSGGQRSGDGLFGAGEEIEFGDDVGPDAFTGGGRGPDLLVHLPRPVGEDVGNDGGQQLVT